MLNQLMVDQNDVLDDFLLFMPGVQVQYQAGRPSYTVNGKLFCTVTDQGIMLRLPRKQIRTLILEDEQFSVPNIAPNKDRQEWLCIKREATHDYTQIIGIFEEAIYYTMMS